MGRERERGSIEFPGGFYLYRTPGWKTVLRWRDIDNRRYFSYSEYDPAGAERGWGRIGFLDRETGEYVGPNDARGVLREKGLIP